MKKILIIFTGFLILCSLCFAFTGIKKQGHASYGELKLSRQKTISANSPKDFINFILNWGYKPEEPQKWILKNLPQFRDDLKFNGVHAYSSDNYYYGTSAGDFDEYQKRNLKNLMDSVNASGLKGVYERIKISKPFTGQRVVYEVTSGTGTHEVNDGFCYTGRDNNSCSYIPEDKDPVSNETMAGVLKCDKSVNNPGFIAENIFENMQHSDIFDWQWNDGVDWYIRPMMRIKQSDFNPANNTAVVAVVTYNSANKRIDSTIIQVRNFRDSLDAGNYSGSYIDIFSGLNNTDFIVNGSIAENKLNESNKILNTQTGIMTKECAVDFKVYWFGKVDVWFDKMTVENKMSRELFSGKWDKGIDEEISAYDSMNLNAYMLFVDELTYSNLPCAKYVYDYIKLHYPATTVRLSCAMTNGNNVRGIREYKPEPQTLKKYLTDIHPEIFTVDAHEFSWGNYIPASFVTAQNYNVNKIFGKWKVSDSDYNEYLQRKVLGDKSDNTGRTPEKTYSYYSDGKKPSPQGSFIYQVRKARDLSNAYTPGSKMIIQPQLHSGVTTQINGPEEFKEYGLREPTNEEIQVQAMTALTHGADGLCWFVYESISWKSGDEMLYHQGFTVENSIEPRYKNMYGQNKWEYIKDMNGKILNWKPVLDKINWNNGYSVHTEGVNHNFVNDIKSMYRNSSLEYANEDAVKYWEMGFFNPADANDKAKYFIMVNRRCIPETKPGAGDLRQLQIKFNSSNLAGYNNWKVIDVNTNQTVLTINISSGEYYNLGVFQPGEGKLYKLEPVN